MNKKLLLKNIFGLFAVLALVWLDQFTKQLAVAKLKGKESFVLIPKVLEFQYAENRGAAFGIFRGHQMGFVILTAAVLIMVLILFETSALTKRMIPLQIVYCMVSAGAIGNMIDRISQNYVVDFIYFRIINFPNFNVADICVTVSCALMIILMFFYYKEDEKLFFFQKEAGKKEA